MDAAEVVGWSPWTVAVREVTPTVAEVTWYFTHRHPVSVTTDVTHASTETAVETLTVAMLERL